MTEKTFLFIEQNIFSEFVQKWCEDNGVGVDFVDFKSDYLDTSDAIAMFHENHNFSKAAEELRDIFDKNNLPIHKVDINGTVIATSANFRHWLERNSIKRMIIIGEPSLIQNENFTRFLNRISARK